jgi:ankyrin repeat protein
LNKEADPNIRSKWGGTPLHMAAFSCDVKCVKALLAFGTNPLVLENKTQTAAATAKYFEHLHLAEFLFTEETRARKGWTAAHFAAEFGDIEALKHSKAVRSSISVLAQDGMSPRAVAIKYKNTAFVQALDKLTATLIEK